VLRFAKYISSASFENLKRTSLNEVDVIRKSIDYKGVELHLLDMTT
jgi:hypothetical protein